MLLVKQNTSLDVLLVNYYKYFFYVVMDIRLTRNFKDPTGDYIFGPEVQTLKLMCLFRIMEGCGFLLQVDPGQIERGCTNRFYGGRG